MVKKNKRKLKIRNIAILIIGIVILLVVGKILFTNRSFKVEMKNGVMAVGDVYENNFTATYKGEDVTADVTVTNNIYNTRIGKYQVTFTYKHDGNEYEVVKDIEIKDTTKPEITLNKGEEITVVLDNDYKEPGYTANDNYDGDITNKVEIKGKVDIAKEGDYELVYSVADSSGNKTKVTRKVIVSSKSPLTMSIKDFSLDGLFTNVLLEESEDLGSAYTDDMIFAGDSMALYYVINKNIPGKRLWHKEGINPETALTDTIYINHIETNKTFIENFKKYQPAKVIMTLGTNSVSYMEVNYFITNYKKLIKGIKEVSPDTTLIIQSIPPVAKFVDDKGNLTNDKINKFNYYILEMCSELDIPFLNSAEVLKDSDGYLKEGYYELVGGQAGIHLSQEGQTLIFKYAQNHVVVE
ncbi:MAG: immunoglobulin-like domain-containing protein [Ignavibacteriales bacterium]